MGIPILSRFGYHERFNLDGLRESIVQTVAGLYHSCRFMRPIGCAVGREEYLGGNVDTLPIEFSKAGEAELPARRNDKYRLCVEPLTVDRSKIPGSLQIEYPLTSMGSPFNDHRASFKAALNLNQADLTMVEEPNITA